MNKASRRETANNCDITRAERAAWVDAFGARGLTVALTTEPAFFEQALKLSCIEESGRRASSARRIARAYAPRGPQKCELIALLLLEVAECIEDARGRGLTTEMTRELSLATLAAHGSFAAYVSDALLPGDARRRPKSGAHDGLETIWEGAQMIARRGAGRCLRLSCTGRARRGDYCAACGSNPDVRRDHNRRLKVLESAWDSAIPHILEIPSKVRARRIARTSHP
jgi:hypothetical protein